MSPDERWSDPVFLTEQAVRMRDGYGPNGCVIVNADVLLRLCRDAVALAELRGVLAGLPDDDWQPTDWALLSMAQDEARTAIEATP